jgi:hypothetical protein
LADEQARGLRLLLLGKGAVFAHRFERSLTGEMDDEEERRARPLLLGKAAVLAHRFERPLAAEMDEDRECLLQVQVAGRRLDP